MGKDHFCQFSLISNSFISLTSHLYAILWLSTKKYIKIKAKTTSLDDNQSTFAHTLNQLVNNGILAIIYPY